MFSEVGFQVISEGAELNTAQPLRNGLGCSIFKTTVVVLNYLHVHFCLLSLGRYMMQVWSTN